MPRWKHVCEYHGARGAAGVLKLLPRSGRLAAGRAIGSAVYALDARHRRVTLENVRLAFGDQKTPAQAKAIARNSFRHFGAMLFEMLSLGRPSREGIARLVEFEGIENFEDARAAGKGVIMVGAHFGNWELHALAHGFRLGRMHIVVRELNNPYLNRWLEDLRRISGNEVVSKQRALGQMRKLLQAGETVGFVMDQNVHLADAVFIDFFGRKAATTPVASWFALKTGAVLVPVFCLPLADGRYRAIYENPIDVERFQALDRSAAVSSLTQELAAIQERAIRRHPEYWLWMHRRWRTRPPAETGSPASPIDPERISEAALT